MKKYILSKTISLLCVLLSALLAILPAKITESKAETDSSYAYIATDDVYLYASSNERSGLFLLPCTYYVKILDAQTEFTKVEYSLDGADTKKITGYCKTEQLTFVDYVPKQPYFFAYFDLTYRIADDGKNYPFLTEITVTCAYYGEYPIGSETYCYVLREDAFGYVPKPADLTVPVNTEYAERFENPTNETPAPTPTDGDSLPPMQIVTVVLLCLLAPILASLILRPTRKHPTYPD